MYPVACKTHVQSCVRRAYIIIRTYVSVGLFPWMELQVNRFTFSRILLHSAVRLQTQSVSIQYIIAKKHCSQDGHGRIWLTSCLVFFLCVTCSCTPPSSCHIIGECPVGFSTLPWMPQVLSPWSHHICPLTFSLSSWANCWIGFVGKVYRKK